MIELSVTETDIYRRMRVETGLSPKTAEAASRGLSNSLYSVLVNDGETPIRRQIVTDRD